jgi:hypothetical protein
MYLFSTPFIRTVARLSGDPQGPQGWRSYSQGHRRAALNARGVPTARGPGTPPQSRTCWREREPLGSWGAARGGHGAARGAAGIVRSPIRWAPTRWCRSLRQSQGRGQEFAGSPQANGRRPQRQERQPGGLHGSCVPSELGSCLVGVGPGSANASLQPDQPSHRRSDKDAAYGHEGYRGVEHRILR